jgi:hypothetical protein
MGCRGTSGGATLKMTAKVCAVLSAHVRPSLHFLNDHDLSKFDRRTKGIQIQGNTQI